MSDYPDLWDFEANPVLDGKLKSINNVMAKKYASDEMVEKFVLTFDVDGTDYTLWLDSAVLRREFTDEAKARKANGTILGEGEGIKIEYLGQKQGATFKYKNFSVTFENAAPRQSGFDALAGATSESEGVEFEPFGATTEPTTNPEPEAPSAQQDEIPF